MLNLQHSHPRVHRAFCDGLFPVRRSDGAWSGIFTDLFIEQVLMVGIKSTGGLTGGLGFDESTLQLFLLSRPICADVTLSIFEISGLCDLDEAGHRDLKASWIRRDMSDIYKLVHVLVQREVFDQSLPNLVSILTGCW